MKTQLPKLNKTDQEVLEIAIDFARDEREGYNLCTYLEYFASSDDESKAHRRAANKLLNLLDKITLEELIGYTPNGMGLDGAGAYSKDYNT